MLNQINLQGTVEMNNGNYYLVVNRTKDKTDKIPLGSKRQSENEPLNKYGYELDMAPLVGQRISLVGEWNPDDSKVNVKHYSSPDRDRDYSEIEFEGTVKKIPEVRVTKKGREVQDILISVDPFKRYFKVVAWERIPEDFKCLGEKVKVKGYMQARVYLKKTAFSFENATKYEVSLHHMECLDGQR